MILPAWPFVWTSIAGVEDFSVKGLNKMNNEEMTKWKTNILYH